VGSADVTNARSRIGPTPTRALAEFASQTTRGQVPEIAADAIKRAIVDTLAVTAAGARTDLAARVAGTLLRPQGDATIIGRSSKADASTAALVNGVAGHALDYDDASFASSAHPSVTLLPPLLALAETRGLPGAAVITAYAVGYQVAVELGGLLNPSHYAAGWHGTGTIGALSATFAVGNLLALDTERISVAVALAVAGAGGLRGNFGTDAKPYQAGNAARNAVTAGLLAEAGLTGATDILEAAHGFLEVYAGDAAAAVPAAWSQPDLWAVVRPGIISKLFPSCASSHTAIAAALELRNRGLAAGDIRSVEVEMTSLAAGNMRYPNPGTGLEAKFSLQYCVAVALEKGRLTLDDFTDDAVAGAPKGLMNRIAFARNDELDAFSSSSPTAARPAVVQVRTIAGELVSARVDDPPGGAGPIPEELLIAKIDDCLARADAEFDARTLIDRVADFDTIDDVGVLLSGLAPKRR